MNMMNMGDEQRGESRYRRSAVAIQEKMEEKRSGGWGLGWAGNSG
jgi:hypothetical protein